MRLFVGIALDDAMVRELKAMAARLRSSSGTAAAGLRWTAPESWHITLQFLGNALTEQFDCLSARLGEVRSAAVPVELGAISCFDCAGVLFADVHATPAMAALAERVVAATSRCGFQAETRPFHPHITLARRAGNKPPQRTEDVRWGPRQGPREQGNKGTRKRTRLCGGRGSIMEAV